MDIVDIERLRRVFAREEICLLGLPFDRVDEDKAVTLLEQTIEQKWPCFLSTPNLNFAIAAIQDEEFRESVLQSDLSVADGMPLIWLSRLIGEPLPERVAGSSLFERMRRTQKSSLVSVFFFGGMNDVAKHAVDALNADSAGMIAVGSCNPGMGSVEEMSSTEIIEEINNANPDFLVVSLGAKKGQAWIVENRQKLNARLLSHLGAVVNFVAGTVNRAPATWQKFGLEWVWRILEEPGLWKRYLFDGLQFCSVLLTKALPLAVYGRSLRRKHAGEGLRFSSSSEADALVLSYSGVASSASLLATSGEIPELLLQGKELVVDLRGLDYCDGAFWAFLLRLRTESRKLGQGLKVENMSSRIKRLARLNMVPDIIS